jgi:hypothetical protein
MRFYRANVGRRRARLFRGVARACCGDNAVEIFENV